MHFRFLGYCRVFRHSFRKKNAKLSMDLGHVIKHEVCIRSNIVDFICDAFRNGSTVIALAVALTFNQYVIHTDDNLVEIKVSILQSSVDSTDTVTKYATPTDNNLVEIKLAYSYLLLIALKLPLNTH